jgi:hypothetical protein
MMAMVPPLTPGMVSVIPNARPLKKFLINASIAYCIICMGGFNTPIYRHTPPLTPQRRPTATIVFFLLKPFSDVLYRYIPRKAPPFFERTVDHAA